MNLLLADPHSTRPAPSAGTDAKKTRSKNRNLGIKIGLYQGTNSIRADQI